MGQVRKRGLMEINILVNLIRANCKEKENSNGQTEKNILVNG
jgi:hypothetical protein